MKRRKDEREIVKEREREKEEEKQGGGPSYIYSRRSRQLTQEMHN